MYLDDTQTSHIVHHLVVPRSHDLYSFFAMGLQVGRTLRILQGSLLPPGASFCSLVDCCARLHEKDVPGHIGEWCEAISPQPIDGWLDASRGGWTTDISPSVLWTTWGQQCSWAFYNFRASASGPRNMAYGRWLSGLGGLIESQVKLDPMVNIQKAIENWPLIVDLPRKMLDFHSYVNVYQRVSSANAQFLLSIPIHSSGLLQKNTPGDHRKHVLKRLLWLSCHDVPAGVVKKAVENCHLY